jgi:predicted SPOUT superfamily RNA methylase MTH1
LTPGAWWPPPRRRRRIVVAVPLSYSMTEHSLLLRTLKWGILGRLAAVFRVDELALYQVPRERVDEGDARLARTVLEYMFLSKLKIYGFEI